MCGRYFLSKNFEQLLERYQIYNKASKNSKYDANEISFRGEIYPSQKAPVVVGSQSRKLVQMKWGFSFSFGDRLIFNARGETVEKKPTFKNSFYNNRCLIPAEAFFEWEKRDSNKKIKTKISMQYEEIFSMAGIFDKFYDENKNSYFAFTILTVEANEGIKKIHNRMPVVLDKSEENKWLDTKIKDEKILKQLVKPYKNKLLISRESANND